MENNEWVVIRWRKDDLAEAIKETGLRGIDIQKLADNERFAQKFTDRCTEEGWEILFHMLINDSEEIELLHAVEAVKADWIGKEFLITELEGELEELLKKVNLCILDKKYDTDLTFRITSIGVHEYYIGHIYITFDAVIKEHWGENCPFIKIKSMEVS